METKWIVRTNDFKEKPLNAEVIRCLRPELVLRATKKLFTFWGIALLSVLIPVLHFFLVPTFLFLGLFFGFRTLGYKFTIEDGSFVCPECSKNNPIKDLWFGDEARLRCEHCGIQTVITTLKVT